MLYTFAAEVCACVCMSVDVCVFFVLFVCCTVCGRIGGDGVVKVSDFGLAAKLNPGHNQYLRPPGACPSSGWLRRASSTVACSVRKQMW